MFGRLSLRVGAVAVAQGALMAGAVGTDMVLGWSLDPPVNGLLQSVFIVTRFLTLAGALGIPTSLYFLYPRCSAGERNRMVAQSFAVLAGAGILLAAAVWLLAPQLAVFLREPPKVAELLRAGALLMALALPALLTEPVLIVQGRPWVAALNALTGAALQVGLVSWAVYSRQDLSLVLYALAAAQGTRLILPVISAFWRPAPAVPAGEGLPGSLLHAQLAVALPMGLTAAIDAASTYADRAIVSRFFDSAALALYRYGAQEVPFVGLLIGSLTPVLLPEFSALLQRGEKSEVLRIWQRAAAKTALVLFGIFWALIWVAPEFLSVLYSPQYEESAVFFRIYLLLLPVRVVAFMPMLYALGRARFVAAVAAGEVVLSVLISLALLPLLGLPGVACGPLLATLVQAVVYLSAIRAALGVEWPEVLPWGELLAACVRAALFFGPLALLRLFTLPPVVVVGAAMIWGGVYLALVAVPRRVRGR